LYYFLLGMAVSYIVNEIFTVFHFLPLYLILWYSILKRIALNLTNKN
jgi:hypothetical protein